MDSKFTGPSCCSNGNELSSHWQLYCQRNKYRLKVLLGKKKNKAYLAWESGCNLHVFNLPHLLISLRHSGAQHFLSLQARRWHRRPICSLVEQMWKERGWWGEGNGLLGVRPSWDLRSFIYWLDWICITLFSPKRTYLPETFEEPLTSSTAPQSQHLKPAYHWCHGTNPRLLTLCWCAHWPLLTHFSESVCKARGTIHFFLFSY